LRRDNSHANNNNNNNNNEECRGKMRRAPAHFVGYSSAKIVKMQPLVKYAKARCCCCCSFCVYGIRWKAFLLGNSSISPSLFSCQLFFSFLTSGNFCIAVRKRKNKHHSNAGENRVNKWHDIVICAAMSPKSCSTFGCLCESVMKCGS
jgi:hypothetical protein